MATTTSAIIDIGTLLGDLDHAAKTPAKQRAINISSTIRQLCSNAYDSGLSSPSLSKLIDILTLPNELDQGTIGELIRNLYPADKVSDGIVVKVVGCLGHGRAKPRYTAQAALLRWLVMVYDSLENQSILSQLYAILFNLLDTLSLRYALKTRTSLCHALSLATRRKHVRPFRIQLLMELMRQAGNEPALVGLMRVYKDYYPDVIVGDAVAGRASVFMHPNLEWRQHLAEIQERYMRQTDGSAHFQKHAFRVVRRARYSRTVKTNLIPQVHTSHALENSVTLEEIEDIDGFIHKLEKIDPPNQLIAVIGDPLLQKFLQLHASHTYTERVDRWLISFFEDQLQNPENSDKNILELLRTILEYSRYTKQIPSACLAYLRSMLHSWNGITGQGTLLELLSYIPLSPFSEMYETTFRQVEDAVLQDDSSSGRVTLLGFYSKLLDRWTTILLVEQSTSRDVSAAVASLINHVNDLCITILQSSQSVETSSSILSFYESAARLISYPSLKLIARITTPPAELVYTLHFTDSLSTLSRLCAVLAKYKRAFEIAMLSKPPTNAAANLQSYNKDYVNHFNGFLMDVCNCLWRGRALNNTDPNALGCLVRPQVTEALAKYVISLGESLTLPSLFSFSTSPILCLLAISHIREQEDVAADTIERRHAGPVTQASLKQLELSGGLSMSWQDYKLGVLQHMENKGAAGIGELMYNTMKHLMAARNSRG